MFSTLFNLSFYGIGTHLIASQFFPNEYNNFIIYLACKAIQCYSICEYYRDKIYTDIENSDAMQFILEHLYCFAYDEREVKFIKNNVINNG